MYIQMRVSAEKCEVRVTSMVTTQILVVFFKDCHQIHLYGDILDVHVLKVRKKTGHGWIRAYVYLRFELWECAKQMIIQGSGSVSSTYPAMCA